MLNVGLTRTRANMLLAPASEGPSSLHYPCPRRVSQPALSSADLPAPEAPTGAAPPILATRARRRRADRLWRPDLQLVEVNGARRGALPGGDARHMLLQDSLLGALAVQVIWGLCWVASRTEPWPDTWTLVSIDTRTPSTRPTLVSIDTPPTLQTGNSDR